MKATIWWGAGIAGTLATLTAGLWIAGGLQQRSNGADVTLGRELYSQYCASCHGANLEGQPDWKTPLPSGRFPAPPHDETGHTWHHADGVLFEIVKLGSAAVVGGDYQSDMPAFDGILTDEQIAAVLEFIKSTWPDRERTFQREQSVRRSDSD